MTVTTASSGQRPHSRPRLFALVTAGIALAALLIPLPMARSAPVEHQVDLDARMFAFQPARLRVGVGDRVTLRVHAKDVMHGVYVDGYDIDIVAEPGKPAQISFIADRAGKFRYRCSVTCGALHPFMIGELVVGPNLPFWRAAGALLIISFGSILTLRARHSSETP